jgi:hypothetical protein
MVSLMLLLNHETQALLVSYGEKNKMQNIYDSNSLISNSDIFMRRASEMLWRFYYMSQGSKTINLASQRENACLSMHWEHELKICSWEWFQRVPIQQSPISVILRWRLLSRLERIASDISFMQNHASPVCWVRLEL